MSTRILAIIPARAGSKGIKNKNLATAYGKPLIQWTIEAATQCPSISKTIVSSDSLDILEFSKQFSIDTILRPDELSTDSASSESVITHCIKSIEQKNESFDYILLLQPTSPARTKSHIEQAIALMQKSNATSLISVYTPEHSPYKSFTLSETGFLKGIIDNKLPFTPRQKLPKTFYPNGAIYLIKKENFLIENSLFTNNCIPFEMAIKESIDIDNIQSIYQFNAYMDNQNEKS